MAELLSYIWENEKLQKYVKKQENGYWGNNRYCDMIDTSLLLTVFLNVTAYLFLLKMPYLKLMSKIVTEKGRWECDSGIWSW